MLALREFYEKDAVKRHAGINLAQPQAISLSMVNVSCEDIILELGCGGGGLLQEIDRRGAIAIGVDLSIGQIRYAKGRSKSGHAIVSDATYLPFRAGQFTKCFAVEILEHVQNPGQTVNEISRVLKNDGELIIVVPNDKNWFIHRILQGYFREAFYNYGHLHDLSSLEKLEHLFEGFKILTVKENNVPTMPMQGLIGQLLRSFDKISKHRKDNAISTKNDREDKYTRLLTYEKHLFSIVPKLTLHLIIKLRKNGGARDNYRKKSDVFRNSGLSFTSLGENSPAPVRRLSNH